MRVALVHSFYSSSQPSGENAVVRDQLEALRGAGHTVELVARDTDVVARRRMHAVRSAATVASGRGPDPGPELATFAPDVVHVHNTFPNWGTSGLRPWASRTVVTLHNFRPLCAAATLFRDGHRCTDCLRTPVLPAVRHRCYRDSAAASVPVALATRPGGPLRALVRDAAEVIVLNEEARDTYTRSLHRPVHVVPNFVDSPPVTPVTAGSGWVYVGRFTAEKGVELLIGTWPDGERLDVVGSGPCDDAVRAAAAGRPGVQVLPPLPRDELRRRLAGYEGLVLPSRWAEGLPTVVLESLAAGVPAVVSRDVAAGAALSERGVVELYRPGGSDELRRALAAIRSGGPELRRRAVAEHAGAYSRQAWLSRIGEVYEQVSARHR